MTELRPFQREVYEYVMSGKNVILQAPTGSGKTRAALLPFIETVKQSLGAIALPPKCIYAVPMRVLANQFMAEYEPHFQRNKINGWAPDLPVVAQQTGEHPNDPEFQARLTFATIDQVLSSFLVAPYGVSARQANINAGAVIGSYLVFDEFHLFDPKSTLPTSLEMLRMLKGITPFVIMTATFSTGMLSRLGKLLNAEIVGGAGYEGQWESLESQQKVRWYHTIDAPLSAERVLAVHASLPFKRSLVICNRVERAQAIFDALQKSSPSGTKIYLLHSRFMPDDRAAIEQDIQARFGKEADLAGSVITVATQAIEVGVDITSGALHTELAPANAIIQRAGRCARYKDDVGDVYIYNQSTSEDGTIINLLEDMSPYARPATKTNKVQDNAQDNRAIRAVIEKSWEAFSTRNGNLSYADELVAIDHAHYDLDKAMLDALEAKKDRHRAEMYVAMNGDASRVPNLVRGSDNKRVIIHNKPDSLLIDAQNRPVSPYAIPAFNLHDGIVKGLVKDWCDRPLDEEPPHRVWFLHADEDPESQRTIYVWKHLSDVKQCIGAPLICVDPTLAGYDSERGFLPHRGTGWINPPAQKLERNRAFDRGYALETYAAHIERIYIEMQDVTFSEVQFAAERIEQRLQYPAGSIFLAARLATIFHDIGKLSIGWQRYVHEWQKEIGATADLDSTEAYAHTDNYTWEHFALEKEFRKKVKRPHHAVESAAAALESVAEGLSDECTELVIAVYNAISRHHAPHVTGEFEPYDFVKGAIDQIRHTLTQQLSEHRTLFVSLPTRKQQLEMSNNQELKLVISDRNYPTFLAYLLLARVLRRADQRGTQRGMKAR